MMPITVPVAGQEVSAAIFGAPVANYLNDLDAGWIAFTPVLATSGGTPGAGPIAGRYKKLGAKTCTFTLTWTWGTGAYGGSGEYRWTLPVPPSASIADYAAIGGAHIAFGTAKTPPRRICTLHKLGGTCVIFGDWGQLTAESPYSVQVGDGYYVYGTYETA